MVGGQCWGSVRANSGATSGASWTTLTPAETTTTRRRPLDTGHSVLATHLDVIKQITEHLSYYSVNTSN